MRRSSAAPWNPILPVAAIALPPPPRERRGPEAKPDTPAELPSGRVSFKDAFGRETALRDDDRNDEPDDSTLALAASANAPGSTSSHDSPTTTQSGSDAADASEEEVLVDLDALPEVALDGDGDGGGAAGAAPIELDTTGPISADPAPETSLVAEERAADAEPESRPFQGEFGSDGAGGDAGAAAGGDARGTLPDLVADPTVQSDLEAAIAAAAAELDAVALPSGEPAADLAAKTVQLHAAMTRASELDPVGAAAASATIQPSRAAELAERAVALSELPRALAAEVDGFLRMRGRGRHWEAEIRLDPPELGALHVRLELRGQTLHGVVRAEDPRLESQLDGMLKDLERQLERQGGDASFDLRRGTHQGGAGPARSAAVERASLRGAAASGPVHRGGAGPAGDRLVDLLA
jgi:flagellar hook-length control protein FliK